MPLIIQGKFTPKDINGYYLGTGPDVSASLQARVANDTLEFLFVTPKDEDSIDCVVLELANCSIRYACGNLYEINCFEQPDEYVFSRIEVIRDTLPTIPQDSIIICFELDSALQEYEKSYMKIKVWYDYKAVEEEAKSKTYFKFRSTLSKRDNDYFHATIYPYQFGRAHEFPKRYPGLDFLSPFVRKESNISVNGANMITVKLHGLTADIFNQFYIAGEYVYCDGETLRWRDLTFKKTSDKRYEKLPRVGRPLK